MNTERRKRANKKQQELLVEKLHANIEIARENTARQDVVEFWAALSTELNTLGCSRTVQQWQHIWSLWVAKVKTKARKVRDTIRATGGGPAGAGLTIIEEKILDIVGSASVEGFSNLEAALPPSPRVVSRPPTPPQTPPLPLLPNEGAPDRPEPPVRRRSRRLPRPRQPVHQELVNALNESARLQREAVVTAADNIAAAMVRSAEIIAAAIQSAGVPVVIQQND